MKDVGTHHFVKNSAGNHSVLVPQPSDDKHDPLVREHTRSLKLYHADDTELEFEMEGFLYFLFNNDYFLTGTRSAVHR